MSSTEHLCRLGYRCCRSYNWLLPGKVGIRRVSVPPVSLGFFLESAQLCARSAVMAALGHSTCYTLTTSLPRWPRMLGLSSAQAQPRNITGVVKDTFCVSVIRPCLLQEYIPLFGGCSWPRRTQALRCIRHAVQWLHSRTAPPAVLGFCARYGQINMVYSPTCYALHCAALKGRK